MTPQEFIAKWRSVELKESAGSHSHFLDLCKLLGIDAPSDADPKGEWFTFEKGATKTTGRGGWADVWRKDCFAWEYKGKNKDLNKAFAQLQQYAIALENPPLLIVSDMDRIRIHTNWTNTVQKVHTLSLEDLADAANRDLLRHCFTEPERLKPAKTRQILTEEAAEKFASLALRLRARGHDPERVAHFVNRLVFCMFAEDVNLLPAKMFERMIKAARSKPETFEQHARTLFGAMARKGSYIGFDSIEWFNGGLFDSDDALPLTWEDLDDLIRASALDWSDIDPSILGTLFERGLDPDKRSQLGAHYTDRDKIMQIVGPVIVEPLLAEWAEVKAAIVAELDRAASTTNKATKTKATNEANRLRVAFMERLLAFRVLDPACGSGNFLYIALLELKNIEHRVNLEAEALGLAREFPRIGPEAVLGIELNPYAAELARVSVWIGEIQWMRRNGFEAARNPILRTLDTIQNRDAVLNPDGTRAEWPKADVVVGNPPFLGAKKQKSLMGETYLHSLREAYIPEVYGLADLVVYWFVKAAELAASGKILRFGLVSTNSIRDGDSQKVFEGATRELTIFDARSDERWVIDGASLHVSLICISSADKLPKRLDGITVDCIGPDLKPIVENGLVSRNVKKMQANLFGSFIGIQKNGPFDLEGEAARDLLTMPLNPHGMGNDRVLRPFFSGRDVTDRKRDRWVIDFTGFSEQESALFEIPFQRIERYVKPERLKNNREIRRRRWWLFGETMPRLRNSISRLRRYIATSLTAKHRVFVWANSQSLCDSTCVAIARDDDATFGVIHSKLHEVWSLRMGAYLGVGNDPRYTPSTTFETFPFPEGLTPDISADDYADDPRAQRIAAAAARLNELRENWLNPPDLVNRVPEVVPGYPDRLLPKDDAAAAILKKRTLTNLYNARPAWLDHAHRALDEAVAEAYGWGDDWRAGKLTDDEILARLFRLNQDRAAAQGKPPGA